MVYIKRVSLIKSKQGSNSECGLPLEAGPAESTWLSPCAVIQKGISKSQWAFWHQTASFNQDRIDGNLEEILSYPETQSHNHCVWAPDGTPL